MDPLRLSTTWTALLVLMSSIDIWTSSLLSTCIQIIHDYQHKGVNNDFLIRKGDSLAVRFRHALYHILLTFPCIRFFTLHKF